MSLYDDVLSYIIKFFGNPSIEVGEFTYLGVKIDIELDLSIMRVAEASNKISPEDLARNVAISVHNLFGNKESTVLEIWLNPLP